MVWRKMLQQESEHQWLAISACFVFALIGAIFLRGTSHLPGIDMTDNELGLEHRIIESVYLDSNNYVALEYSAGEYNLVSVNNGEPDYILAEMTDYDESRINNLELLTNDSVLIGNALDNMLLHDGFSISPFTTNYGDADFLTTNIKQSSDEEQNYLMITLESDNNRSIRGLNSSGITSAETQNLANVDWEKIQHISNDLWMLSGRYNQPATTGDESPAAPNLKPVWATVLWNGGYIAPMFEKLHIGEYGEYHSMINLNQEKIIIAGTHETILFDYTTGSVENIGYSSVSGVADKHDSAWLFNGKDSRSVLRFHDESWEVKSLPHVIPLTVETTGFDGETIYLHGIDDNGAAKVMTFDTTAVGSIESGSGFINLAFIIISLVMFAVMTVNISDKFR